MQSDTSKFSISPSVFRMARGLVLRSNSVLITIYGDAFAPREQAVWLGSLITLVQLFGLSSRLVRTSASRLTADDWFTATRLGRRSYYGLSDVGLLRVRHADRRIYEFTFPKWDGKWTLAVLDSSMTASTRQHLKRELLWESFGQLSPSVFAHPHADHDSLREILNAASAKESVAILSAESIESYSRKPLQSIMHQTFKLAQVKLAWKQFIARFSPLVSDAGTLTQPEAFFIRTLLIHEYRRVLLRDPNLPEALLPESWPGVYAKKLCEKLYRAVLPSSENFLQVNVETLDGSLIKTPHSLANRLSGI